MKLLSTFLRNLVQRRCIYSIFSWLLIIAIESGGLQAQSIHANQSFESGTHSNTVMISLNTAFGENFMNRSASFSAYFCQSCVCAELVNRSHGMSAEHFCAILTGAIGQQLMCVEHCKLDRTADIELTAGIIGKYWKQKSEVYSELRSALAGNENSAFCFEVSAEHNSLDQLRTGGAPDVSDKQRIAGESSGTVLLRSAEQNLSSCTYPVYENNSTETTVVFRTVSFSQSAKLLRWKKDAPVTHFLHQFAT